MYACQQGETKSVVIGAKVRGIEELFEALRQAFAELESLPSPALHVTLYKYNHRYGIGIQSRAQLDELCHPILFEALPTVIKERI